MLGFPDLAGQITLLDGEVCQSKFKTSSTLRLAVSPAVLLALGSVHNAGQINHDSPLLLTSWPTLMIAVDLSTGGTIQVGDPWIYPFIGMDPSLEKLMSPSWAGDPQPSQLISGESIPVSGAIDIQLRAWLRKRHWTREVILWTNVGGDRPDRGNDKTQMYIHVRCLKTTTPTRCRSCI